MMSMYDAGMMLYQSYSYGFKVLNINLTTKHDMTYYNI